MLLTLCVALCCVLVPSGTVARPPRPPPPPPPPPPLSPASSVSNNTTAAAASGTITLPAGVPTSYPGCSAGGFPTTPFDVTPFSLPYKQSPIKAKSGAVCDDYSCMDIYELDEVYAPAYELVPTSVCAKGTKMLLYDGMFPAPTVVQQEGRQAMLRFTNKINVNEGGNPYGEVERPWGIAKELHNMCEERADRTGNPNPGTGRALTVHHHGMVSLAPFDGWAEDVHCYGESKDYVLPGNRAAAFWFHDHGLGTTSENTYAGLEGTHIVTPCKEHYNLENIPQYVMHFLDVVLDKDCQMVYDKSGAHFDNIFGDINTINGVAFPKMKVQPRYTRFRMLNGAVSRALSLNFQDAKGKKYNDRCRIVGSDGGVIGKDRTGNLGGRAFPTTRGLFMAQAYRWDIVCDFRGLEGSLFLTNEPQDQLMKPTPQMFCNSHLIARIDISATDTPSTPLFAVNTAASTFNDPQYMADYTKVPAGGSVVEREVTTTALAAAEGRAMKGAWDRQLNFGKSGDYWLLNGLGWDENVDKFSVSVDLDADQKARDNKHSSHLNIPDVGQNTVEVWQIKSGGGWVHPVHAHLIEWHMVAIEGKPVADSWPEFWQVPKDVVQIGAGVGTIDLVARYGPSLGRYMVHCHNGVHEDRDMMVAFSVVPPGVGKKTAAGTGFDADIAKLFEEVGGKYSNGDLNARYGDRFYPAVVGGAAKGGTPSPQVLPLKEAAEAWHKLGFYSTFYGPNAPNTQWKATCTVM